MDLDYVINELLRKYNHNLISVYEAAREIKPGMSGAAVRTALSRGRFPLPTFKILGIRMVRILDLAALLVDPKINFQSTRKYGRGRPQKL